MTEADIQLLQKLIAAKHVDGCSFSGIIAMRCKACDLDSEARGWIPKLVTEVEQLRDALKMVGADHARAAGDLSETRRRISGLETEQTLLRRERDKVRAEVVQLRGVIERLNNRRCQGCGSTDWYGTQLVIMGEEPPTDGGSGQPSKEKTDGQDSD